MDMVKLIEKVKQKGVLRSIPDKFVREEIEIYLKKDPKANEKKVFKGVRKRMHETYGAFQTRRKKKRNLYLEEYKIAREENEGKIKNSEDMKIIRRRILRTNLSTRERLDSDYGYVYNAVAKIINMKINSLMDLGCGINPVALCPFTFRKIKTYAYDIDTNDIAFLNKYFKVAGLKYGVAKILSLHDLNKVRKLPEVDVCLLLKIIDPLERRGHKFSEELIKAIKCKYLVVSFATKTISRKQMNHPQRGWFERMVKRLGFTFKTIKTKSEIYYILWKK